MVVDFLRPLFAPGFTALRFSNAYRSNKMLKRAIPPIVTMPCPASRAATFPPAHAFARLAIFGAAGIAGVSAASIRRKARRNQRDFGSVVLPARISCATQTTELEYDCWETARVDPEADFSNVRMVFGYGSMCWRQEFPYTRAFPVVVHGFSRRFWQRSCDHRGTPEAPGRVLTLVRGDVDDVVHGVAFEIASGDWPKVLADLDIRERHGYVRTVVDVSAPGSGSNETCGKAVVYYAYRPEQSRSYVGPEDLASTASVIATAKGPSGKNDAYLFNLLKVLGDWGLPLDPYLTELADEVRRLQAAASPPSLSSQAQCISP